MGVGLAAHTRDSVCSFLEPRGARKSEETTSNHEQCDSWNPSRKLAWQMDEIATYRALTVATPKLSRNVDLFGTGFRVSGT